MARLEELELQNQNLEAQLVSLYEEKQQMGDLSQVRDMVKNLEGQLISLYEERASNPHDLEGLKATVHSLEEQLISLYEEKAEYTDRLRQVDLKVQEMKMKSKAIGAALLEAALFGEADQWQKKAA